MATQSTKPKRVPQRTCIACRRVDSKRQLVRVVRTADQRVLIDLSGKQAGRGAYICASQECWQKALKRGAINRALKLTLSEQDQTLLSEYAQQLPTHTIPEQETAMN